MSDIPTEPAPESAVEAPPSYASARPEKSFMTSGDVVAIVTVLAISVVLLCCIGSCALIGFAFMQNPPW